MRRQANSIILADAAKDQRIILTLNCRDFLSCMKPRGSIPASSASIRAATEAKGVLMAGEFLSFGEFVSFVFGLWEGAGIQGIGAGVVESVHKKSIGYASPKLDTSNSRNALTAGRICGYTDTAIFLFLQGTHF